MGRAPGDRERSPETTHDQIVVDLDTTQLHPARQLDPLKGQLADRLSLEHLQELIQLRSHTVIPEGSEDLSIACLHHQRTGGGDTRTGRRGGAFDDFAAQQGLKIARHLQPNVEAASGAANQVVRYSHDEVSKRVSKAAKRKTPANH